MMAQITTGHTRRRRVVLNNGSITGHVNYDYDKRYDPADKIQSTSSPAVFILFIY